MFCAAWKKTIKKREAVVIFYSQSIFILSDESWVFPSFSDAGWSLIAYFLIGFLWTIADPWCLMDLPPSFLLLLTMFKSVFSPV